MGEWWARNVVDPGKLPLLLCAAAFVVTFLATRAITRMIRAGVGPFRDNVSAGGTHVHHAVPGIVLLVTGALVAVGAHRPPWPELAAVAVGAGTSLVLDEFALILHLQDVYWSQEGRLSVEMVSLTFACLAFALVGALPFGVDGVGPGEAGLRGGLVTASVLHAGLVLTCAAKGKYRLGLLGIFVPVLAWAGAVRIARPGSPWARRRYGAARRERAERRAARFDARWDPVADRLSDLLAGRPTAAGRATARATPAGPALGRGAGPAIGRGGGPATGRGPGADSPPGG
jgi:hypothetical protein